MAGPGGKTCLICKQEKPAGAFARNSASKDGLMPYCKPCKEEKYEKPRRERNRQVVPPTEGTMICRVCTEEKPVKGFYWRAGDARYETKCLVCRVADKKVYNTTTYRSVKKESDLLRKYGLTGAQVQEMASAQGGCCAVCGEEGQLVVDHCHITGAVRKLLCGACNKGLGFFRDDTVRLKNAIAYLESGTN